MMQYFEWYLPSDSTLWNKAAKEATKLANMGITRVWLPPAYKGSGGQNDVGYAVYDLYDLGEFNQKGSIPTKYGTKEEYLNAIRILKENNIKVYADIVLNHKMGADELEEVLAVQDNPQDRTETTESEARKIRAWTKERIRILVLNGIGHISMVLIGMILKRNHQYLDFMGKIGMRMQIKKMEILII